MFDKRNGDSMEYKQNGNKGIMEWNELELYDQAFTKPKDVYSV